MFKCVLCILHAGSRKREWERGGGRGGEADVYRDLWHDIFITLPDFIFSPF